MPSQFFSDHFLFGNCKRMFYITVSWALLSVSAKSGAAGTTGVPT